jgi:predicted enzyme related to lactoylglutathione lyase
VIGTLRDVAFDAPDHLALVRFYAELLGGRVVGEHDEWAVMTTPDGWRVGCQPVAGFQPSTWPTQQRPQQLHLDLQTRDVGAAAERAQALGAVSTGSGDGEQLLVLTDPAGHPFCLCASDEAEQLRIFGVCLDCPDPVALASFYAPLLGMPTRYAANDGAWLSGNGPLANVTFQGVADYNAPRWPDPEYPQQAHLDVLVDDIDAAEAEVVGLGGRPLGFAGGNWRVYADPADHPFCLVFDSQ